MPKKPAQLQLHQQKTHCLPWFDCSHLWDSLHPYMPILPPFSFSPVLLFTSSGWNVSTHFSHYALCWTDVGEQSLCCAGELSRHVKELLTSCNSESTSVWRQLVGIFPLLKSARMYAQVWKLFIQIIKKKKKKKKTLCWNIHISILFENFSCFKVILLNLNCKLTLQSLPFVFRVSNQNWWETRVTPQQKPQFCLVPQFAKIAPTLSEWSVKVQVCHDNWVIFCYRTLTPFIEKEAVPITYSANGNRKTLMWFRFFSVYYSCDEKRVLNCPLKKMTSWVRLDWLSLLVLWTWIRRHASVRKDVLVIGVVGVIN